MAQAEALHAALTRQQRRVLGEIAVFHRLHGYAPTVREIQAAIGYGNQSSVHGHLVRLRHLGLVWWVEGQVRTLTLTEAGREAL